MPTQNLATNQKEEDDDELRITLLGFYFQLSLLVFCRSSCCSL